MSSSNPAQFLLPSDEKFNGSNWVEWKSTIWAAAKSRGLLGYLNGDIARPSPGPPATESIAALSAYWGSPDPTLNQWLQRDAYTQGPGTHCPKRQKPCGTRRQHGGDCRGELEVTH
ncbi:hypothetical protein BDZ94DRAFT_1371763 [Collybia nuda]|uniref:Retrotransposon Copia-like N-terminal domain-containing protein n=1 Tax=Collybia nuda TaxID=64659 RepID=A0A9P5Y4X3_9AGAR|nr:hypothetical protein BDZ94DRAFT_1371763 [Collybia nuda]